MTLVQRMMMGACWGIALGLLTMAILTALYPEPCVEDGIVTNREACETLSSPLPTLNFTNETDPREWRDTQWGRDTQGQWRLVGDGREFGP